MKLSLKSTKKEKRKYELRDKARVMVWVRMHLLFMYLTNKMRLQDGVSNPHHDSAHILSRQTSLSVSLAALDFVQS